MSSSRRDQERAQQEKAEAAEARASWKEFGRQIHRRLDAVRPDRIASDERDWREPVYAWARNHMPNEATLVRRVAKYEVDRCAAAATREGNKYLTQWKRGLRRLFWAEIGPKPIVVGKLHVRLDAATTEDLEVAARQQEVGAKQTYDAVIELTHAMQDLARAARRQGLLVVSRLGNLEAMRGDEGILVLAEGDDDGIGEFDDELDDELEDPDE